VSFFAEGEEATATVQVIPHTDPFKGGCFGPAGQLIMLEVTSPLFTTKAPVLRVISVPEDDVTKAELLMESEELAASFLKGIGSLIGTTTTGASLVSIEAGTVYVTPMLGAVGSTQMARGDTLGKTLAITLTNGSGVWYSTDLQPLQGDIFYRCTAHKFDGDPLTSSGMVSFRGPFPRGLQLFNVNGDNVRLVGELRVQSRQNWSSFSANLLPDGSGRILFIIGNMAFISSTEAEVEANAAAAAAAAAAEEADAN
jgi:hypothetical protein